MLAINQTYVPSRLNFSGAARVTEVEESHPDAKNGNAPYKGDSHDEPQQEPRKNQSPQSSDLSEKPLLSANDPQPKNHALTYEYQFGNISIKTPPEDYKGHHLDLTG